jgi:hypothetical protein
MTMDETVDYQGLFEVIRKENERLRMTIVSLKDNGYTLKNRVDDLIEHVVNDPMTMLYIFMAVSILLQVVLPLLKWVMEKRREK